ncbi:HAD family hydrolase [Albirhodobacter sp. R86504]|uniref:HAD family hydrolase n=1 Tax=Albirhodobacter sp. R86504 TaxID=3093848 RepID=UPI00366B85D0
MTTIAGILFDKDGTLFDFNATWGAWAGRVLTDLAAQAEVDRDALGARVGYSFETGFAPNSPIIAATVPEIALQLAGGLPRCDPSDLVDYLDAQAAAAQVVEVVPLAKFLADLGTRGLRLGVMTNDSEASARAHLAAVGVADVAAGGSLEVVIGADSGHGAKPSPEPLLAFARHIDLAPENLVMVGDSRHDLSAGRAAGMVTVGVLTGPAKHTDLADLADVILPSIADLPQWLSQR